MICFEYFDIIYYSLDFGHISVVCRYITYPTPTRMEQMLIVKNLDGKDCRNMILIREVGNISMI